VSLSTGDINCGIVIPPETMISASASKDMYTIKLEEMKIIF